MHSENIHEISEYIRSLVQDILHLESLDKELITPYFLRSHIFFFVISSRAFQDQITFSTKLISTGIFLFRATGWWL